MASGASSRSPEGSGSPHARLCCSAITFDFGNTLVRVDQLGLRAIIELTADVLAARGILVDRTGFIRAWAEERDRQFREDVPEMREADIYQRAVRVLARLRGMAAPAHDVRWDDRAAGALVALEETGVVFEAYGAAFVDRMTPVADAGSTLERLAGRGFVLGILSNWPLALTIDRFADAQGWTRHLRAIVVSQRVGTIKPHVSIFRAAETALGVDAGHGILHVGDDWAADVVGASQAGWRTAYLRDRPGDSPLPRSQPGDGADDAPPVVADLEIDELAALDALVEVAAA
jgi:FMN phosphatase YigB (HAD superfamily)